MCSFTPLPQKSESGLYASNKFIHTDHSHFLRYKGHSKADNFFSQHPMAAVNTFNDSTKSRDQHPEETSEAITPTLDQRKGDISQPILYMKADTVSEPKNDCGIVQRHATAKSSYLADLQPEDSHWTFSDRNEIEPTISTSTAVFLPKLSPDTVCTRCGCLQISHNQWVDAVSCDGVIPYQPNNLAAAGWGLEKYRSTEPYFNPPGGLNNTQGGLVNHALRPEVTTSDSPENDLDDFSWFMAS